MRPEFRPAPEAAPIGVFGLPDPATTLAGLLELSKQVRLTPEDDVVLLITGTGFKNLDALDPSRMKIRTSSLSDLEGILSGLKARRPDSRRLAAVRAGLLRRMK